MKGFWKECCGQSFLGKSRINIIMHMKTTHTVINMIQSHKEQGLCVSSSSLSDSLLSFSKLESASFVEASSVYRAKR